MSKNYTDTALEDWIYKITARFYELAGIIMKDPSECRRRFPTDDLIVLPNPCRKAA